MLQCGMARLHKLFFLLLPLNRVLSTNEFYVSLDGDNQATGTTHQDPFATVDKCLKSLPNSGGTCWISGGRYDRVTDTYPLVVDKDVTLSGDPLSSSVPIFDGSILLDTTWKQDAVQNCVYRSGPLATPLVWQLWTTNMTLPTNPRSPSAELDGFSPLTPARFPNARLHDDTVFEGLPSSINSSLLYSKKTSRPGTIVDAGHQIPSMASSGIDFAGMIAVLPLGTMGALTQGVKVTQHGVGKDTFSYVSPSGTVGKGHLNIPFFFEGSCKLLDIEGEWCLHSEDGSVSVWLEGCVDPSKVQVRGKVRDYLVSVTKKKAKLKMQRLVLWGGTLKAPQTNLILDRIVMAHPSANRYVLGEIGMTAAETVLQFNEGSGSLRMTNSTMEWSQSVTPLDKLGVAPYFSDNDFLRSGYSLGLSASLGDKANSRGLVFQHNTVRLFNSFTGITPGLVSTVAYNVFGQQTYVMRCCTFFLFVFSGCPYTRSSKTHEHFVFLSCLFYFFLSF